MAGVKRVKNVPLNDLTGKRFGRLLVLFQGERVNGRIGWVCRCDCGTIKTVGENLLSRGLAKSCGCLRKEVSRRKSTKHSLCGTKLYHVYCNMKKRCYDPKSDHYKWYGAENKTICDEWMGENGFKHFSDWAFENGYEEDLTIDRIDNNKGYSPDNCRWVTMKKNCQNKRNNHLITVDGVTMTISEWSDAKGLSKTLISTRINQLGWDEEKAVTTRKMRERKDKKCQQTTKTI